MTKAVVIVTCDANKEWLKNLLSTIPLDVYLEHNVQVFNNGNKGGYELAAIHWAIEQEYDEFVLLHDTVEIKDTRLFDVLFDTKGSVSIGNNYFMYMGKYELKHLQNMNVPHVNTKMMAINEEVGLMGFCGQYTIKANATMLDPTFTDTNNFEEKLGNKCMVLENQWLRKYKRTWNTNMVKPND